MYAKYSETFSALPDPWTNPQLLKSKERIGRELFLSAMEYPNRNDQAYLIESSAALGIAAACRFHYLGIKTGKYGFKVDATQLQTLRAKYASVKLKELQYMIDGDHLASLKGDTVVYLDTLLEYAESGNETAISEYLELLSKREDFQRHRAASQGRGQHNNNRGESLTCPYRGSPDWSFNLAKKAPPHDSLADAAIHYTNRGSKVALEHYLKSARNEYPQFPGYRGVVSKPVDAFLLDICKPLNPSIRETEVYRHFYLQYINSDDNWGEKTTEFATAGSEWARYKLLNKLAMAEIRSLRNDKLVVAHAVNRMILDFIAQGSRVGQTWHILGLTSGMYGFEKDPAQARRLRVEYGILGATDGPHDYFNSFHWFSEIY